MNKKEQVKTYVQMYANLYSKAELYTKLTEVFDITRKQASNYYNEIEREGIVKPALQQEFTDIPIKKTSFENEELKVDLKTEQEIKTLEELLFACDLDTTKWKVISWECTKWEVGRKDKAVEWHIEDGVTRKGDVSDSGKIHVQPLWRVKAKFAPRTIDTDLNLQKDVLLKELFTFAPKEKVILQDISTAISNKLIEKSFNKDNLLEIALFDIHFGKLSHHEEVGEDYDLKIACKRFKEAITTLLSRVNINSIEKILLPIGQDLINVDNLQSTTTGGTPQDCDSRFHKIVKVVKNVLIESINELSTIAPIDVVISVGNHDEQTTFMIGEMLDAYYHHRADVNVYNDASLRKYYQYGVSSIMFTHGNKEKFNELGMIFAAENPKLWAETKQRYIQIGHFHHNKKVTTIQGQEFQGFQVQILPSLSGTDAWHKGKGYQSLKQAKAFLYSKTEGLIGEFNYTVN